jgi:predicted transcriptional regulator
MAEMSTPTSSELAILQVLWKHGPATVREVHSHLADGRGYTTVLKLMQIMAAKGLVLRDEGRQAHVYRAAIPEAATQRSLARGLLDRAFDGSASKLLVAALSGRRASRREMAELRALLDQMERGAK